MAYVSHIADRRVVSGGFLARLAAVFAAIHAANVRVGQGAPFGL